MDGILFDEDFAKNHSDVVEKFIQGSLEAADMYNKEFDTVRNVMPMFNTASDEDIKSNCSSAKLTTWKDNMDLLNGTAKTIYSDMCKVWMSIGETVNTGLVDTLFDDTYVKNIADNFDSTEVSNTDTMKVTNDNKDDVENTEALLSGSASVTFIKNTAKFSDSAKAAKELDKFIKMAKVLDGAIIEIAGNTDPNPNSDPKDTYNKKLSFQRAETVKKYFTVNGVSADRIVVIGNGSKHPVVKNDTEAHRAMNRRTDVSFKIIER